VALLPGTRLGPYEIVDRIGAGAMGEVYSARDARLHRRVAIKVLPPEFSRVPDRVARFSQEAKAAAALNHPGVVSIFDVGVDSGVDGGVAYVVSELLEGETLRALLSRAKIPRKRAGDLASQMAAGMAAAHHKGIVHRDLKPENVFITHEGRAKILDFGLARLLSPGESLLATTADTMAVTSPGMVLGTVGYMAPEQVRGEPADHRSDIFAFGAVFYEMLAGHAAFSGGSAVERMHAVLHHEPAAIMPGVIPDPFERIARRCLEKDPAQRFQSADDVAFAIEAVSSGHESLAAREGHEGHGSHERRDAYEGFEGHEDRDGSEGRAGREGRRGDRHGPPHASPHVASRGLPLAAMGAAANPRRRWRWLGAAAIAAAAAVGLALGVALSRGLGVAGRAANGPATGPSLGRAVVPAFEARTFDRLPITNARFMPDGQTIVYSAPARGDLPPDLFIINANAEAPQPLGVPHAHLLSVSSKGELALLTNATPLAHRLHGGTLARMTIGSSPRPVMELVREADWSPDGNALAIVHDLGNGRDRLEYPAGTPLHEASGYLSDPRVSPDGSHVAFAEHPWRFDDRGVVKIVDRGGRVKTLTGDLWGVQGLAWSADGSRIIFSGNPTGGALMQPMSVPVTDVARRDTASSAASPPAAASSGAQPLFGVPGRFIVHDVARDGRMLAVREDLIFGVRVSVPAAASQRPPALSPAAAGRREGSGGERDLSWLGSAGARALSRDGAWLLMVDIGLRSGRDYGVLLRGTNGAQPIRLGEGNPRRLSPDGKWAAAFLDAPARLVLYPTGSGEAIRLNAAPIERLTSVDWFPDGRRLLVCGSEASRAPRCYTWDVAGKGLSSGVPTAPTAPSSPKPLTADCRDASVAPDGRTLLLTLPDGSWQLSSSDGGQPRPAMGLRPGDRPIAWSRDSRSVYVQRGREVPAFVDRVTLTTGARATVREIAPTDVPSLSAISVSDWMDDGRGYAYNYTSVTSTLFLVSSAMH
jgi:eukaryotic-like serine/threonine-protein kinase